MKKCTKHGEYFPDEDDTFPATEECFYKHPLTRDHLLGHCKR